MLAITSHPQSILPETALADLGEIAGPLTHEVNDLLNSLTLHFAVIEMAASEELAGELRSLRQRIARTGAMINRFQSRRQQPRCESALLDMNAVLEDAVGQLQLENGSVGQGSIHVIRTGAEHSCSSSDWSLRLQLERDLPAVRGHLPDMHRLARFLLGNAFRSLPPGGPPVVARTSCADDRRHVRIVVEDVGQGVPVDALQRIFCPGNEQRVGMCCLELALCRSIARRSHGTIEASAEKSTGLAVTVTLPAET
jgi:signal transduction histidine kinase